MEKWKARIGSLGDDVVNPGTPMGKSKTVGSDDVSDEGGSNPLSGFSIVEADSMDAALDLAKGCPHLEHCTIEVAEMIKNEYVVTSIIRQDRCPNAEL